ncbi:MAG: CRISPR-associated helicase Cas3' [Clostridia bacterium]
MHKISHINYEKNVKCELELFEHCRQVSDYAFYSLENTNFQNLAKLSGLYHDAGKASSEFQDYIERATSLDESIKKTAIRGSINHTFFGVKLIFENHYNESNLFEKLACEIIAYTSGAHHGLFDISDINNGTNGFDHRKCFKHHEEDMMKKYFYSEIASKQEVDELFVNATYEIEVFVKAVKNICENSEDFQYYLGCLVRLVLSSIIEADRKSVMQFMKIDLFEDKYTDFNDILNTFEENIKCFTSDTPINIARGDISNQCKKFAKNKEGIYKLSVPTGGGKTLSSLRYTLNHIINHNKKRCFFVMPLLAIIEQNANEIRKYTDFNILEHHSNVINTQDSDDELSYNQLITGNWKGQMTVTTLVQLLNTMFDHKTTSICRFNALIDSVIVIDEVQTIPIHMQSMFNNMVNFLQSFCKATVILCSATQPPFAKTERPINISSPSQLVSEDYVEIFERTEIISLFKEYGWDIDDVSSLAQEITEKNNSTLIICNKKSQAKELFEKLSKCEDNVFHLSTSLCKKHRQDTLENIKTILNDKQNTNQKIIVISTQLIEAGVDISFSCVIRAMAGLDNVIQAAGRCNRNGSINKKCPVYIVNFKEEALTSLPEIQKAKDATNKLLENYKKSPDIFDNKLDSKKAIDYFYKQRYKKLNKGEQDYPIKKNGVSLYSIYSLLSENNTIKKKSLYILKQSFKTAAKEFKVFNDNTIDIIVPYGQGQECIANLCSDKSKYDLGFRKEWIEQSKPYIVSVYEYELKKLNEQGAIFSIFDNEILALNISFYDEYLGIKQEIKINFMEV